MKQYNIKTSEPSLTYYGAYSESFREQAHQLIAWGYADARHRIRSSNEQEPAITGFIAEAINNRLRASDCPGWCAYYSVKDDPPVERKGSAGRTRPRADMIIEAHFKGRPEYVFEAKRLRTQGFGANKYIGIDGMGCFVSGLYASRYDEATMLGYVQSDSLLYWKNEVKSTIDRDKKQLHLKSPQSDKEILKDLPHEWISAHDRESVGRPITTLHILLDCVFT
ncbi:MAG: hypothetical protein HZA11_13155 [Nitrospirae bacterium]|nr:hypothetical protein [Nitrospirota bacterium]